MIEILGSAFERTRFLVFEAARGSRDVENSSTGELVAVLWLGTMGAGEDGISGILDGPGSPRSSTNGIWRDADASGGRGVPCEIYSDCSEEFRDSKTTMEFVIKRKDDFNRGPRTRYMKGSCDYMRSVTHKSLHSSFHKFNPSPFNCQFSSAV